MITFKEYISEEHQVGDRVSWFYNKYHPRYPGKITKRDGEHFIVKSEGDGQFYRIHKTAVNQYGKPDANLNEATIHSNKDGKTTSRQTSYASSEPNSYRIVSKSGEHLASVSQMKDPKYNFKTNHWHVTWHKDEHWNNPNSFQHMSKLRDFVKQMTEEVALEEMSHQEVMGRMIDSIPKEKHETFRKLYTSHRSKGLSHAAASTYALNMVKE